MLSVHAASTLPIPIALPCRRTHQGRPGRLLLRGRRRRDLHPRRPSADVAALPVRHRERWFLPEGRRQDPAAVDPHGHRAEGVRLTILSPTTPPACWRWPTSARSRLHRWPTGWTSRPTTSSIIPFQHRRCRRRPPPAHRTPRATDELDLAYVQATGLRGLHVVTPLDRAPARPRRWPTRPRRWRSCWPHGIRIAHRRVPQGRAGRPAVPGHSTQRLRPGPRPRTQYGPGLAPVATLLTWDEVDGRLRADGWTIAWKPARVSSTAPVVIDVATPTRCPPERLAALRRGDQVDLAQDACGHSQ